MKPSNPRDAVKQEIMTNIRFIDRVKAFFSPGENVVLYDDIHNEIRSVLVGNSIHGSRKCELLKTINQNIQISSALIFGDSSRPALFQFGGAFTGKGLVGQVSMSQDSTMQVGLSHSWGQFSTKLQTIISRANGIYTQLEHDIKNRHQFISFKVISPIGLNSSQMYVFSCVQAVSPTICVGSEVICSGMSKSGGELGISLCGRYAAGRMVGIFNLQQFSFLSLGFFRKLNDLFKFAWELNVPFSKWRETTFTTGLQLETHKSTVKAEINNRMKSLLIIEEKLGGGATLSLDAEIDYKLGNNMFGMGFTLER
jgi:hypothetical protein